MTRESIIIRPATVSDIDAIYAISCRVHLGAAYRDLIPSSRYDDFVKRFTPNDTYFVKYRQKYFDRLADPSWFYWVAEADGKVCGFTLSHMTDEALELKGLFVDEVFQGQGIGRRLFDISCSIARTNQPIILDVIAENKKAKEIYLRSGFHLIDETPDSFFDTPMIRMQKY